MRHRFSPPPRSPEAPSQIPNWPSATIQPGDVIRDILRQFGARVGLDGGNLRVQGTDHIHGVDLDLNAAAELTPVVAAVAALPITRAICAVLAISAATRPIGWLRSKPS